MRLDVRRACIAVLMTIALLLPVSGLQAADLPIYTDSLAAGWADWSWGSTRNFGTASPVHGGSASIAVTCDAWGALYLHANAPVDLSGYESVSFWIHGGTAGNQQLRVVVNDDTTHTYTVTAQAYVWTEVTIPLSALGNPASLSELYWQDTTGGPQPAFYLDDIRLIAQTGTPAGPAISLNVAANRHAISEGIYGMNFADEDLAQELRLPVRRWGGNSTTRYNWQTNMHNTGSDWYFENIPEGAAVANGSASDLFVDQDRRTGSKTIMTVPLIGWTPKSGSPRSHPYACGFKISKYGAQTGADYDWDPDCGNGVRAAGGNVTGNDATDTSVAITPDFVTGWINHLVGKYGTAANGGVAYYNLDNEPMLWNSTHRDVHPAPTTYDEMRDKTYAYAAAIKAADPSAKTLGPVLWGWCAYFWSAQDGCGINGTDYQTHGNQHFVPWYLQQMQAYEQQHGVRILDYLDLHIYPQNGEYSSDEGDVVKRARRLRSTRSLWDPNYVDESWIDSTVRLIPRMKEWIAANYPGTKTAITEYNWGALGYMNGALAQADILGIFGREGLDLATLWGPPSSDDPGAFAFRLYRNYDGTGRGFGDVSVQATSTDQDRLSVYAAQRSSDNAVTVIVINKTGSELTSAIGLSGFVPATEASVYRYSSANLLALVHLPDQQVTASGFSATFPANSVTLFVLTPERVLTVTRNGTGSGTVTSTPAGIACGDTCSFAFNNGASVALTAVASAGSVFAEWGGGCSGNGACTVVMDAAKSVAATFTCSAVGATSLAQHGSALSGVPYTIAWGSVAGATGYDICESLTASFDGEVCTTVTTTSRQFTHTVAGLTTYYYRVRAKSPCGTGPFSATSTDVLAALPAGASATSEVVCPVSGTKNAPLSVGVRVHNNTCGVPIPFTTARAVLLGNAGGTLSGIGIYGPKQTAVNVLAPGAVCPAEGVSTLFTVPVVSSVNASLAGTSAQVLVEVATADGQVVASGECMVPIAP